MADIGHIAKDVSIAGELVIYPYKDIEDDSWPVYVNREGKKVPYSYEWREVGFKVPYPTVGRLRKISDLSQGLQVDKSKFKVVGGDPDRLAKYLVFNLIKGTENLTDGGKEISWEDKYKNWLYDEFRVSSFLLNNFRATYELVAGEIQKGNDEDEENFTKPSGGTSSEPARDTKSGLKVLSDDTPQNPSDGE